MEGLVSDVGFEEDFKEKLSDHDRLFLKHESILCEHDNEIHALQINAATLTEKINSIEGIVTRFETNSYQTQGSMLQLLSQVIVNTSNNNTEIIKVKDSNDTEVIKTLANNRNKVILKILVVAGGIITTLIVGYLGAKYGVNIPAVN